MSKRRAVHTVLVIASAFAVIFLGLGNYLAARQSASSDERIAALSAEVELLRQRDAQSPTGTAGRTPEGPESMMMDDESRAAIIADVKRELSVEMGLLPLTLLRERRNSFVELNSFDDRGTSNYGTAGYLGNGYFITVKHAVIALGQENASDPRRIESIKLKYKGKLITAQLVDAGDARAEVDPGDWAILRVKEPLDLPAIEPQFRVLVRFC